MAQSVGDLTVEVGGDHVATVEIHRPPANYFDVTLIRDLADVLGSFDRAHEVRAVVLCAEGRHFCAGADFTAASSAEPLAVDAAGELYRQAVRVFAATTPLVAAVQGAAIGGGLGLACAADFRVASEESRFSANFARLGFHQGFGLSVTLPAIVGNQRAAELLLTGKRIGGVEAHAIGLVDRLVAAEEIRAEAHRMAGELAEAAPLAVASIRETMRGGLAEAVRVATLREEAEQARLRATADFAEGVAAGAERRAPVFRGE